MGGGVCYLPLRYATAYGDGEVCWRGLAGGGYFGCFRGGGVVGGLFSIEARVRKLSLLGGRGRFIPTQLAPRVSHAKGNPGRGEAALPWMFSSADSFSWDGMR